MKVGRNELCPCGSGNKYKRCCINAAPTSNQMNQDFAMELARNVSRATAMTSAPASNDESQAATKPKASTAKKPTQSVSSADKKTEAPAKAGEDKKVAFSTPNDVSKSPVMRYLQLILNELVEQGGAIKATAKGNLPAKLVRDASELLPEFAVSEFKVASKDNHFSGTNEANFNALNYSRILAESARLIRFERGRFHAEDGVVERYKEDGLSSFFIGMLNSAVVTLNEEVFKEVVSEEKLPTLWISLLESLQSAISVSELAENVSLNPQLVNTHFVMEFLQYWGFIAVDPTLENPQLNTLPLFKDSIQF